MHVFLEIGRLFLRSFTAEVVPLIYEALKGVGFWPLHGKTRRGRTSATWAGRDIPGWRGVCRLGALLLLVLVPSNSWGSAHVSM